MQVNQISFKVNEFTARTWRNIIILLNLLRGLLRGLQPYLYIFANLILELYWFCQIWNKACYAVHMWLSWAYTYKHTIIEHFCKETSRCCLRSYFLRVLVYYADDMWLFVCYSHGPRNLWAMHLLSELLWIKFGVGLIETSCLRVRCGE